MRTVKSGRLNFLEFETKILISYLYTDLQSSLRENIDLRLSVRIISKTVMSKTLKIVQTQGTIRKVLLSGDRMTATGKEPLM